MKTLAKTLLAGGLGLFGMLGAAQAALPYGYSTNSYGIAAGGCYSPATSTGYGSAYRPTGHGRSAYDESRFHTLPYPSTQRNTSYDRRDDDCEYGSSGRLSSKYDRYENRFDRTPSFEPWRPASTSHRLDRWNW
jgi:hypothetical protein